MALSMGPYEKRAKMLIAKCQRLISALPIHFHSKLKLPRIVGGSGLTGIGE
jgi:hypothetical protein